MNGGFENCDVNRNRIDAEGDRRLADRGGIVAMTRNPGSLGPAPTVAGGPFAMAAEPGFSGSAHAVPGVCDNIGGNPVVYRGFGKPMSQDEHHSLHRALKSLTNGTHARDLRRQFPRDFGRVRERIATTPDGAFVGSAVTSLRRDRAGVEIGRRRGCSIGISPRWQESSLVNRCTLREACQWPRADRCVRAALACARRAQDVRVHGRAALTVPVATPRSRADATG
jgi:hypothetical protein